MPAPSSLRYLWAGPATALGLAVAAAARLCGASTAVVDGVIEVTVVPASASRRWMLRPGAFAAITLGHVVIAATAVDQSRLRRHERVHVAQYERWGPVFLLAYPLECVYQFLRGRRPYVDNRFEVEARQRSMPESTKNDAVAGIAPEIARGPR